MQILVFTALSHFHCAWQAEKKKKNPNRKKELSSLYVLVLALVLKSIFRIIQISLHLFEPRKILEMKRLHDASRFHLGIFGHTE